MVKVFLLFTILLAVSCARMDISAYQSPVGYWQDINNKSEKYRFFDDGTLIFHNRLTVFKRTWKIEEYRINVDPTVFLIMSKPDGEHIATYVPIWNNDTLELIGLMGDDIVLERIE